MPVTDFELNKGVFRATRLMQSTGIVKDLKFLMYFSGTYTIRWLVRKTLPFLSKKELQFPGYPLKRQDQTQGI